MTAVHPAGPTAPMTAAVKRVGSWWLRPKNQGRVATRQAADRWIDHLASTGSADKNELAVMHLMARVCDREGMLQKSIAWFAARLGWSERTVQRTLRNLSPSRAKDPEGWAARRVDRRMMHQHSDTPGKRADNVPSWFKLMVPAEFFGPVGRLVDGDGTEPADAYLRRRPRKRPDDASAIRERPGHGCRAILRRRSPLSRGATSAVPRRLSPELLSPGEGQSVTQAVILGTERVEINETFHPCTNLDRALARLTPDAAAHSPRVEETASPQAPRSGEGHAVARSPELVVLAAKLFESHAPVAHKAVARLEGLGLTEEQIRRTLKRAARDPSIAKAQHPLLTAVWRVEHTFRTVRGPTSPPKRQESIEIKEMPPTGSCSDLGEFAEQRRRRIALPMLTHEERTTRARENVRRAEEALRGGFGTRRAVERAGSILADIEQNRDRS